MSIFDTVLVPRLKRTTFDLSHDVKLTTNFGVLTPFMCEEVVPGDTWYNKSDILVRMSPLIAPVMHRMWVTTHFFYVPFRLLWNMYEDFETGGKDGKQEPRFPVMPMYGKGNTTGVTDKKYLAWAKGTLADYLNYPSSENNDFGGNISVSQLPFRAYQMIFNEYYRDENLEEEVQFPLSGGNLPESMPSYYELLTLRKRAWRKDYFTSALPWPQKGKESLVPLAGSGTMAKTTVTFDNVATGGAWVVDANTGMPTGRMHTDSSAFLKGSDSKSLASATIDNSENLSVSGKVQLEDAGVSVNDLRKSIRVQRWAEAKARGGSRLKEYLLSMFGVDNDDLRVNRPAYLGGGETPIRVTDIVQTSETTASSPQGQYAGLGYSFGSSNEFKRTFKERGYIMGIMSIVPECGYVEGLPRGYAKESPTDFYLPQFADLGEQEIYNYELSMRLDTSATKSEDVQTAFDVFGYAPRYAEYKYIPNRVHGDFKDMKSYGYWTLNRHYESMPHLNSEFIRCDAEKDDLNRIFAVEDEEVPKMLCQIVNHTKARRPMPYLPTPTI